MAKPPRKSRPRVSRGRVLRIAARWRRYVVGALSWLFKLSAPIVVSLLVAMFRDGDGGRPT